MKNLWQRYQRWRERRRHWRLERWEKIRAKGKMRFVLRGSLIWGGTMILFLSVMDFYYDRTINFYKLLGTAIYVAIVGPIIQHITWWDLEGKRTNAKLNDRMKSIEKITGGDGET